jgi:hypothetical protein
MTLDEAIAKIGQFTRDDAISLIAGSHGHPSFTGQPGHPLDHCELTWHSWPTPRFHAHPGGLSSNMRDDMDAISRPTDIAKDLSKGSHTLSWTDAHLVQGVADIFKGNGAFTALYNLQKLGVGHRLEFRKPTSHTAGTTTARSQKQLGVRHALPPVEGLTCTYLAILDHCAPSRLQLQTMYAVEDTSREIFIRIRKYNPGHGWSAVFEVTYPA